MYQIEYLDDIVHLKAIDDGIAMTAILGARPGVVNQGLITFWTIVRVDQFDVNDIACMRIQVPFFHISTASKAYLY